MSSIPQHDVSPQDTIIINDETSDRELLVLFAMLIIRNDWLSDLHDLIDATRNHNLRVHDDDDYLAEIGDYWSLWHAVNQANQRRLEASQEVGRE